MERRCYLNSNRFISWNFPSIKIIPNIEAEIKSKIHSLKQTKKNHQVTMK